MLFRRHPPVQSSTAVPTTMAVASHVVTINIRQEMATRLFQTFQMPFHEWKCMDFD